jgi:hypothetical protein
MMSPVFLLLRVTQTVATLDRTAVTLSVLGGEQQVKNLHSVEENSGTEAAVTVQGSVYVGLCCSLSVGTVGSCGGQVGGGLGPGRSCRDPDHRRDGGLDVLQSRNCLVGWFVRNSTRGGAILEVLVTYKHRKPLAKPVR